MCDFQFSSWGEVWSSGGSWLICDAIGRAIAELDWFFPPTRVLYIPSHVGYRAIMVNAPKWTIYHFNNLISYISAFYYSFPLPKLCSEVFDHIITYAFQARLRNCYIEGTISSYRSLRLERYRGPVLSLKQALQTSPFGWPGRPVTVACTCTSGKSCWSEGCL